MTSREPDTLFAARLGSPLVLGITDDKALILASDPAALMAHTKQVVYLNDQEYLVAHRGGDYTLHDLRKDETVNRAAETPTTTLPRPAWGSTPDSR